MIARALFPAPGDWPSRNGGKVIAAIFALCALADWLADIAGAAVASLP
ncbi:MAG: hypothetical protein V4724_26860 [Pseudomonadota bacterium]